MPRIKTLLLNLGKLIAPCRHVRMFVPFSSFLVAVLASISLAAPDLAFGQAAWIGDTRTQVEAKLSLAHQQPPGQALVALARQMLGRPYSAFSLDVEPTERVRLDLSSFDCVLLIEQLLALIHSRTAEDFPNQVMLLRYKDSAPDYCSRNHYFSLWAKNAEKHGFIKDISPTLAGASTRARRLSFMSSHPGSYRPMRQVRNRQCISELERTLNVTQTYVPLSALATAAAGFRSGDIFALVTAINGLDVTHTGILEHTKSGLNALHAVPDRGVVRSMDFVRYASGVEDVVGVSIYRPLAPLHLNQ